MKTAAPPKPFVIRPHPKQQELIDLLMRERQVIACCGRRFGKTFSVAYCATFFGLNNPTSPAPAWADDEIKPPTAMAIVGPDFRRARRVWDELTTRFKFAIARQNNADLLATLVGGATIEVYSAENIDAVRGGGYDVVILEEAVFLPEAGVNSAVKFALLDRVGRRWEISTPKFGKKNWFNIRYDLARTGKLPGVVAFHATIYDNSRLDKAVIDEEKANTDPLTWQEEAMAEALEVGRSPIDPGKIQYIDKKAVPGNTYNILIMDTAWGRPDRVDRGKKERKDATVLQVLGQDNQGNVYSLDGVHDKYLEPEEHKGEDGKMISGAFEHADRLIRQHRCQRFVVEHVGQDMFGPAWREFASKHGTPKVGMVRPTRPKDWEVQNIRYWAGRVLGPGRFFMVKGNPLIQHLVDEAENYNEADARADRCATDTLVTCSDILQPEVWQGRRELSVAREGRRGVRIYDPPEDDDGQQYESLYSIV